MLLIVVRRLYFVFGQCYFAVYDVEVDWINRGGFVVSFLRHFVQRLGISHVCVV